VVVHHQKVFVHRLGPQDLGPPRTGTAYRLLVIYVTLGSVSKKLQLAGRS
jgi:hypothetical protein